MCWYLATRNDLSKPGVRVIMASPKTSGGGRWSYLAAWGYALKQPDGSELKARNFVGALVRNAPGLSVSAGAALTTFVDRGVGDVLLAWESDALPAEDRLEG